MFFRYPAQSEDSWPVPSGWGDRVATPRSKRSEDAVIVHAPVRSYHDLTYAFPPHVNVSGSGLSGSALTSGEDGDGIMKRVCQGLASPRSTGVFSFSRIVIRVATPVRVRLCLPDRAGMARYRQSEASV